MLRSTLTDISVRSLDETRTYAEGYDYQVFPGKTSMPFRDDAEPFAVARLAQGRIADGQTVVVAYEHVPTHTSRTGAVLCLAEPGPQRALAAWTAAQVDQYSLPFFGLHVSEEPAVIGKGPRCRAAGLSPSELLARYYADLDAALKEANPDCRLITFVDDFMPWQHAPRSKLADTASLLPADAIAHCWDYSASQAVPFNVKCAALWTRLGHEFLFTGWYNFRNLRTVAAAAKWARDRGMPCLGTSSWAYHPSPGLQKPAAFLEETAACAWRVPRPGEAGYVDPAVFDQALERLETMQE